jgi:hypothetical protein
LLYSPYLGNCSEVLANHGVVPSDALLPYLIRLQRIQEEVRTTFRYDDDQSEGLDGTQIQLRRQDFENQLAQLRRASESNSWNNGRR